MAGGQCHGASKTGFGARVSGERPPVARELAPAGARSAPKTDHAELSDTAPSGFGAASQPSGSKLPRHKSRLTGHRLYSLAFTAANASLPSRVFSPSSHLSSRSEEHTSELQ